MRQLRGGKLHTEHAENRLLQGACILRNAESCQTFRPVSMAKRSPISPTAEVLLIMLHTVVIKNGLRHFGTWDGTVQHLGEDSSALRSELSLGHFGTSADLSGQFGPTKLVPKCPGSEVSWVRSVRNS